MSKGKILISGASIAGPTLAFWLQRYGFEVTVVERSNAPRLGGYAVDFRGSSLQVLKLMGLEQQVRELEVRTGKITLVDQFGRKEASMPDGFTSGELEIMRSDLVAILYRATSQHAQYLFDDSIKTITDDGSGVDVTFERAAPARFDLVVGADGLHSKVRSLHFGPATQLRFDLGYYIAIFTTDNFLNLEGSGLYHTMLGKRVGVFSAQNDQAATVSFYFASAPLQFDRRDQDEQMRIIEEQFKDAQWCVPELLKRMRSSNDLYFDSISQVRMDHWYKGRVVLLGDAGYCPSPVSGMGTSLAMVGAYVLAGELTRAGADLEVALNRYENQMKPFVAEAQKLADGVEWFVPTTRWRLWLSGKLWKILPEAFWRNAMIEFPKKIANMVPIVDYLD